MTRSVQLQKMKIGGQKVQEAEICESFGKEE